MVLQLLDCPERTRRHSGRKGVGEQLRTRSLGEHVAQRSWPGHESARCTAERLPECRGDDVDFAEDVEVFSSATASCAEDSGSVRVVNRYDCVVIPGQLQNLGKFCNAALHREHAV